jgi:Putative 2OG-Fe(II) oxygenase
MRIGEYFPTRVYTAALQKSGTRGFNHRLLQECRQLRDDDVAEHLVLFESWLRHEVAPNPIDEERISVRFNYNWF